MQFFKKAATSITIGLSQIIVIVFLASLFIIIAVILTKTQGSIFKFS